MTIAKVFSGDPTKPLKLYLPDWMSGAALGAPTQGVANAEAAYCDDLIFDDNTNDFGASSLTAGMVATNPNIVILDYSIGARMMPTNANAQTGKYALSAYTNGGPLTIVSISTVGHTATLTCSAHGIAADTYSSTVAAGSNGQNINALPGGNLSVAATAGATGGSLVVMTSTGPQTVTYTGTSGGNTFTGCASSASGVISTGDSVCDGSGNFSGVVAIGITGSPVSAWNGTFLCGAIPSTTTLTFQSQSGTGTGAIGVALAYGIIGNSHNPIADCTKGEYRFALLNGWGPSSGSSQAGIGLNRHLFSYSDYQGALIDTHGRSIDDGSYVNPQPWDYATNAPSNSDRILQQNSDAAHFDQTHLARVDPGASFGAPVTPSTPSVNPAGSNRGLNPVTGYRFPLFTNALQKGDQYWGVDLYSTVNVTSSTVSGTKITFVTSSAHGLGVGDWACGLNLTSGSYGSSDGHYRVTSVTSSTQFTVQTYISGLSSSTGGTIQRSAANRIILQTCDGSMMESCMRFSTTAMAGHYPSVNFWLQHANAMIDCQLLGRVFLWCTKIWVAHTHVVGNQDGSQDSTEDANMDQWHKLCLATYLLANNGRAYFHFRHDYGATGALDPNSVAYGAGNGIERYQTRHRYYTAITSHLGTAVDTWNTQPTMDGMGTASGKGIDAANVSGVYKRQFTTGIVLVNPSSGALNFALPGGLGTLHNVDPRDATNYGGTISVPANSGLILTQ